MKKTTHDVTGSDTGAGVPAAQTDAVYGGSVSLTRQCPDCGRFVSADGFCNGCPGRVDENRPLHPRVRRAALNDVVNMLLEKGMVLRLEEHGGNHVSTWLSDPSRAGEHIDLGNDWSARATEVGTKTWSLRWIPSTGELYAIRPVPGRQNDVELAVLGRVSEEEAEALTEKPERDLTKLYGLTQDRIAGLTPYITGENGLVYTIYASQRDKTGYPVQVFVIATKPVEYENKKVRGVRYEVHRGSQRRAVKAGGLITIDGQKLNIHEARIKVEFTGDFHVAPVGIGTGVDKWDMLTDMRWDTDVEEGQGGGHGRG